MKLEDEKLSAWIDGALDEAEARRIAELTEQEPELAERAVRLRRIDDLVKTAVPEEPVSQELLERLGLAPAKPSNVVDFAAERSRRTASPVAPERQAPPQVRFWDSRKVAAVLMLFTAGGAWALFERPLHLLAE